MWSKKKKTLLLLCIAGVLALVTAAALLVTGLLLPYRAARNTMVPGSFLSITTLEDGTLQASWPAGENAESYELQVLDTDGTLLHVLSTADCMARLPQLPADRDLTVRIISSHTYSRFNRKGDAPLEATLQLSSPRIRDLNWKAEADIGTVTASFDMGEGDLCRVYMSTGDGAPVLVDELQEGKLKMVFGAGERYEIPAYDQSLHISFQLERKAEKATLLGNDAEGFTITREHLLGTKLQVEMAELGANAYRFTWSETKGAYYDVRLSDDGGATWVTMAYIPADAERAYTTPSLRAYTDYCVSIVAVGGQTMPGSEFAAVAETIELHTGPKLLYSTIWPLMDQKVYAAPDAAEPLGTVAAGSAWCVLGQEGDYLKIRYQQQDAYIDSDYCLINLPEYIGNLCLYNITNSYDSKYMVHEYGINKVTGTVITGYEQVQTAPGEYLAPLLFPTAQKLIKAGEAAKEQGYTLKIYDSFRPQSATSEIYRLTSSIMHTNVPAHTYTGKVLQDLHKLDPSNEEATEPPTEAPTEPPAKPVPTEPPAPEPAPTDPPAPGPAPTEPPATEAPQTSSPSPSGTGTTKSKGLTYKNLMTNYGEHALSSFLAPGTSRHNFGVALDLTIVDANGNELSMQTSIHDLSWYSIIARNNGNANILYRIMTGANLRSISSEWWHFQDNETYNRNYYQPLKSGVSWQCWVADHVGWRYRLNDGSFYANCTQTIEDQSYTFDENGYLVQ